MSGQSSADDPRKRKKVGASRLFDKVHQAQFKKMDSITTRYAARSGTPSNAEAALVLGKRKSTAGPVQITEKTLSRKVVPGRFGDDDDDDDGEEEDREDDVQKSKRVRIDAVEETERKGEEAKKLKDREVIRQEVDANKASISSSGAPPVSNVRVPWFGNSKHATSGSSLMPVIDSTSACTSKSPIPLFLAPGTTSRMSHSRSNSTSSLGVASRRNNAGSVSSMGMKTFLVGKLRGTTTGTTRARISTLMAPTASSLAKTRRLPVPSDLPFQVKAKGKEKEKEKEKELQKETDAVEQIVNSLTVPRSQSKIFSQPLILMNPLSKRSEPQMSLSAVAATPRRSLQSRRSRR